MVYVNMVQKMLVVRKKFFLNVGTLIAIFFVAIGILALIVGIFETLFTFSVIYSFGEAIALIFQLIYGLLIAIYFPFVKLWIENNPMYDTFFAKKKVSKHILEVLNGRNRIDRTTTDDVKRTVSGTVDRFGNLYNADLKEYRSRKTAEIKKGEYTDMYILRYMVLKPTLFLLAWLLTPFIGLIAIPRLKKIGLESILDEQLTNERLTD
ncbi:hypothetical protein JKN55_000065 [Enterococcus faecalis]|nr:hypothetical protein [Enterococcus faecalis]EHG5977214.1 hypothetical protein [Enterococcus faecalis]EJX8083569.1 hypothetical protein [Enterococcus faecalis]HBC7244254.1 hypothetical protein [Enterococcus faecalis]